MVAEERGLIEGGRVGVEDALGGRVVDQPRVGPCGVADEDALDGGVGEGGVVLARDVGVGRAPEDAEGADVGGAASDELNGRGAARAGDHVVAEVEGDAQGVTPELLREVGVAQHGAADGHGRAPHALHVELVVGVGRGELQADAGGDDVGFERRACELLGVVEAVELDFAVRRVVGLVPEARRRGLGLFVAGDVVDQAGELVEETEGVAVTMDVRHLERALEVDVDAVEHGAGGVGRRVGGGRCDGATVRLGERACLTKTTFVQVARDREALVAECAGDGDVIDVAISCMPE